MGSFKEAIAILQDLHGTLMARHDKLIKQHKIAEGRETMQYALGVQGAIVKLQIAFNNELRNNNYRGQYGAS